MKIWVHRIVQAAILLQPGAVGAETAVALQERIRRETVRGDAWAVHQEEDILRDVLADHQETVPGQDTVRPAQHTAVTGAVRGNRLRITGSSPSSV